jgi:hypothetical protein
MAGVDINTVKELAGHKTLQMTLRYSHLSQSHKQRAVDILNQRLDTNGSLDEVKDKEPIDELAASLSG